MFANRVVIDDVCRSFDLGTARSTPFAVAGGLSNRLYRLVTDRGVFAVKRMVAHADAPEFKRNVEAAFAVERLAQSASIAMPEPIPVVGANEALARITDEEGPGWVRVHRWVDGTPVDPNNLEPGDRAEVGAIVAALHQLPLIDDAGTTPVAAWSIPDRDWPTALSTYAPASVLAALADDVSMLEAIVQRGHDLPSSRAVLSHRDLDAKNLLRNSQGRLLTLDWDAAGPTDAQWDAVGVAFDWSGVWHGAVSAAAFAEVLDAYEAGGGRLDPITPGSFAGWAEGMLGWLWFNLERSGAPDERERRLGQTEVAVMTRLLPIAADWIGTASHGL